MAKKPYETIIIEGKNVVLYGFTAFKRDCKKYEGQWDDYCGVFSGIEMKDYFLFQYNYFHSRKDPKKRLFPLREIDFFVEFRKISYKDNCSELRRELFRIFDATLRKKKHVHEVVE